MVSKYSTGIPVIQPVTGIDPEFAYNVISKKQEKYDLGFLAVQERLNKQSELDLLRSKDIEYVNNKLKETTETIENLGNIDYSDGKVVGALGSDIERIKQDSTVKKAVISTANYRQWQTRLAKLKENPKTMQYTNPVNEQWDMLKINNYIEGKTDSLDINSPTLYTDVQKEMGETLSKLKGQAWNEKNKEWVLNGQRVTERDVEEAAKAMLQSNPRFREQLKINAWAKYKEIPDDVMLSQYKGVVDENVATYSLANEEFEKEMNVASLGSSEADKARYEAAKAQRDSNLAMLNYWKSENSKVADPSNPASYTGDDIKLKYETENTIGGLGKIYSWSKAKQEENAYEIIDRKQRFQLQLEAAKAQSKLELEQYKATFGTGAKKTGSGGGFGWDGNMNSQLEPIMDSNPVTASEANYYKEYSDRVKAYQTTNFDILKSSLAKVFDERGMFKAAELIKEVTTEDGFDSAYVKLKGDTEFSAKDKKIKDEIFNLYNGILKTYNDARDGKIDNFDIRVMKPDIRENMNLIAQNANSAARLKKELSVAESRALQDVYGGNRAEFLKDAQKARKVDTSREAYDKYLKSTEGSERTVLPDSYEDWKKAAVEGISSDRFKKYQEQLDANISGTQIGYQTYLISEGQLGKANYDVMKTLVSTQASSTGITIKGETDVFAYQGTIADGKAKNDTKNMDKFKGASDLIPQKYDSVTGVMQVRVEFPKDSGLDSEIGYVQLNSAQQKELINKGVIPKKDFMTAITEEAKFNKQYKINGGATAKYWTTNADIPFEWQVKEVEEGRFIASVWLDGKESVALVGDGGSPFPTGEAAARYINTVIQSYVNDPTVKAFPNTPEKKKAIFDFITKDSRINKYQ